MSRSAIVGSYGMMAWHVLFYKMLTQCFRIPTSNAWVVQVPYIFTSTWSVCSLSAILMRVQWYLTVVLYFTDG